jgi:4-hydroxybutyrate CoA-transferase
MRNWEVIYSDRQTSASQAISAIQSSHKVFLAPFCNEPGTLIDELVQQKGRLQDVTIYNTVIGSPCIYAEPDCHPHFQIRTFLSSPRLKSAFLNEACDYLPVNLSEIPRWITQENIDIALIQVTPPNGEGYCNLGLSVDVVQTLIKNAKYVIAEVNSHLPWTYGDTLVHVSEIDHFVFSARPLLTIPRGVPSKEEEAIGHNVAELIPNHATIQVGIGRIADSILLTLKNKKALGIHSGSIIDPVMDLMKLGVITNEYKEVNRFKTVCTTLTGTEELYAFADKNPEIELHPSNYTHHPGVIANISNFYSINSALEVDLFGQINAEQVGQYPIGGVGGQMDFIKGSKLSHGGRSIIALPSTAKNGTQSRIKTIVSHVTSLKSDIDYVVTEYGIATLFGKSLKERVNELIAIAHPNFRQELIKESQYVTKR